MMVIIACRNAFTTKRIAIENLNIYLKAGNKEEIEYYSALEACSKIVWLNLIATVIVSILFFVAGAIIGTVFYMKPFNECLIEYLMASLGVGVTFISFASFLMLACISYE